ncbi:MAG: cytochrome c oxidase assembly protein, partial [Thermomicrobia bacterium]|nr:cytochrome c oxidase assembly protein [Thermomicrobia bacterium]
DNWGVSAAMDQQLGGLMMWVPGGLLYLGAIIGTFIHWQNEAGADEELSRRVAAGHAAASSLGEGI